MVRLPLATFVDIEAKGMRAVVPPDTLLKIKAIVDQISAPDYNRAPQFPKRQRRQTQKGDWERTKRIRATKIKKGNASLDKIREAMNKISSANYEKLLSKITEYVKEVPAELAPDLCSLVFQTAHSNLFFSKLYAKLFIKLTEFIPELKECVLKMLDNYADTFNKIESPDPVAEYDRFCDVNKENAKRRAAAVFLANLVMSNYLDIAPYLELLGSLQDRAEELCSQDGFETGIQEVAEVQYLVAKEIAVFSKDDPAWTEHCHRLRAFGQRKAKDFPSLTHKAVFRYMDATDIIAEAQKSSSVYRPPSFK